MRLSVANALSLLLACGLTASAHAQQPHAPRDTAAAPDTVRLPEVTVTATRTPARILDVPLAVTVVGRQELRNAQGNRVDQALRTVPGVLAQTRTGGVDLRIVCAQRRLTQTAVSAVPRCVQAIPTGPGGGGSAGRSPRRALRTAAPP